MDAVTWTLTVDGMVDNPMTYTIADLQSKFEVVTMALAIECGGNGRAFFDPPARGNQWTFGAVACSEWKDRKNKASIAMFAGVSVRSLWGSTSLREPTRQRNRG